MVVGLARPVGLVGMGRAHCLGVVVVKREQFNGWDLLGTSLGWLVCGFILGVVLL